MSELNELISRVAYEVEETEENVEQSCEKTLCDYHAVSQLSERPRPRLRMIAWDNS